MSSPRSEYAADLLWLAVLLVPVGLFGMFVEMIGSSHNDRTLEWPWFVGSAGLVVAAALSVTSIAFARPARPCWLLIAYPLSVAAGGLGLWGLSVPLLDGIG